jgi:hypothetical protein
LNGYIYTSYQGADPGHGWIMSDPILAQVPTLGACVPNIRRAVKLGDWIFTISGRVAGAAQYVVGGFEVTEKINQLVAFERFPENRVRKAESGQVVGNVIVTADGSQNPDDNHTNFERRIENYLVGRDPIMLERPDHVAKARAETLGTLSRIFQKEGNRVFDIVGRHRKMNEGQVHDLRAWLETVRG